MVDINLIGDDQPQFDSEDNENDFQDTYSSDANELTQNSYMRGDTMDNSDYAKVIRRGGSKVGIYALFFIVIALLGVTAYILFWPGQTSKTTQSEIQTLTDIDTQMREDTTAISSNFGASEETPLTTEYISPALKEKILEFHHGINTIRQIINAIPANVNFTMITYSDGKFLFELLASGGNDINGVNAQLQQGLYSADLKLLSQDMRQIKGRQYHQALMNGSINVNETPEGANILRQPQFLSTDALNQQLTLICQQNSLTIKQFDTGIEKPEEEVMILPINIRIFGLKGNIMNLLQQLQSENINISLAKISVIATDVDLNNPNVTLVINMALYRTT